MGCEIKQLSGTSACGKKLGEVNQYLFFEGVPEFDSIQALKSALDNATVAFYATDAELEQYTPTQEETKTYEYKSGRIHSIKRGATTYSSQDKTAGEFTQVAYESLNKRRCSFIRIDSMSNFEVYQKGLKITPVPMSFNSMRTQFQNNDGSETPQGLIFMFSRGNVNPENLAVISPSDAGFEMLGAYSPLIQAEIIATDVTTTTAKIFLYGISEGVNIENGIAGIAVGDITLTVNGTSVTPTSFDSATEGVGYYDLVYPSQSTGDKLLLDIDVEGYDSATVASSPFWVG